MTPLQAMLHHVDVICFNSAVRMLYVRPPRPPRRHCTSGQSWGKRVFRRGIHHRLQCRRVWATKSASASAGGSTCLTRTPTPIRGWENTGAKRKAAARVQEYRMLAAQQSVPPHPPYALIQ